MSQHEPDLERLARDVAARATAAVGLAGIALIHLLDSIDTYADTRYLFWMYVALMLACLGLAALVLRGAGRGVWLAAGGLSALVILGFILSRTTGLPSADDDVGNWTEPLGLASLFVEGCVLAVSAYGFTALGRSAATARHGARTATARVAASASSSSAGG